MIAPNMPIAFSYVRFSTLEQKKGDSLRRQIEQSQEYAKKHGLILDENLQMEDQGLSAFKGHHKTKGALGEFLKLVEQSKIPQGSVLIVENLDRLSREQVLDALNQFTSIIKAGISIVTLQDNMKYSVDSINNNWAQLIISITYMARAHEESLAKSKRLSASWENKRHLALTENKIMTKRLPAWLALSKDRKEFKVISEVATAIEMIFLKKRDGKGTGTIEKELNFDSDLWKPKTGWRMSYIQKLLPDRRLLGEFQPGKMIRGRSKPVGEPIKNYFPQIIDKDLFDEVQAYRKANGQLPGRGGGRTGKCNNLFVHIAKCGLCGKPMHYIDKGKTPKGRIYLHCDGSRRLKGCSAKAIRYDEFEQLFFDNFEELTLEELLPQNDEIASRLNSIDNKIIINKHRISEIKDEVENLSDTIAKTKSDRVREQLEKKLSQAFDEQDRLDFQINELQNNYKELADKRNYLREDVENATEIYQMINAAKNEQDRIGLRFKLHSQIKKLIKSILIYPLQKKYKHYNEIEPGIWEIMDSKFMEKIKIVFKGSKKFRLLLLTSYGEEPFE